MSPTAGTVDQSEVDRFSAMAAEWWDPKGKFKPLHKFNPIRLSALRREIAGQFGRDSRAMDPLTGLRLIDIGCGGGLISEPMARLGATVTSIDPSPVNIEVAKLHAATTATVREPSFAEALAQLGFEPYQLPQAEFAERIRQESAKWGPVVAASGFSAES